MMDDEDGTYMVDKPNGWIIRRVIYPVLEMPPFATFAENYPPEDWSGISSVTRIELIWGFHFRWPTAEELHTGVYECYKKFAAYPDVIMANFPTKYQGIDIR